MNYTENLGRNKVSGQIKVFRHLLGRILYICINKHVQCLAKAPTNLQYEYPGGKQIVLIV